MEVRGWPLVREVDKITSERDGRQDGEEGADICRRVRALSDMHTCSDRADAGALGESEIGVVEPDYGALGQVEIMS